MSKARFTAELIEGHGGVTALIVPFDPEEVWGTKPVALDARRQGWLVRGRMNGKPFDGWIGYRWGRHFILVDADLRRAAGVGVGDTVAVVTEPTTAAKTLAKAQEQAKLTTAPGRRAPRTALRKTRR